MTENIFGFYTNNETGRLHSLDPAPTNPEDHRSKQAEWAGLGELMVYHTELALPSDKFGDETKFITPKEEFLAEYSPVTPDRQ